MKSYTEIYIQAVLPVFYRQALILPSWEDELYKYITGIIQKRGHKMIAINGMPDHLHMFYGASPKESVSEMMRELKKSTNVFINDKKFCEKNFKWAEGYGAFSYEKSLVPTVANYVMNQKIHHRKITFQEEYLALIKEHGLKYDEKYPIDFCPHDIIEAVAYK
jgi:REP element-mobilizing transposase RayT